MNFLWIGSINWFKNGNYIIAAKTAGAVSSSAFEQSIIEGLEQHGHSIRILTDLDNDRGRRFEWSHNDRSRDICTSGISIKYVRLLYKSYTLIHEINMDPSLVTGVDAVIIYSVHVPYFALAKKLKNKKPGIKIILICPDLSEYMDPSIDQKPIKKILRKIESVYIHQRIRYFDGIVWFTSNMREILHTDLPSIVMEGVFSDVNLNLKQNATKGSYVLYAGSLNSNFGIQNIVSAFNSLKDELIDLRIFGTGELENRIREEAEKNPHIIFEGFVDRNKLFEYEKSALLLINARNPEEIYTRYSFPSKMFEYMVSGTPVISTRLAGIPEEYDSYLYFIPDNRPETIANEIRIKLQLSQKQRDVDGEAARCFILDKKNKEMQSIKLHRFIDNLVRTGV